MPGPTGKSFAARFDADIIACRVCSARRRDLLSTAIPTRWAILTRRFVGDGASHRPNSFTEPFPGGIDRHEAYLATQEEEAHAQARLPPAHVELRWAQVAPAPPIAGTQSPDRDAPSEVGPAIAGADRPPRSPRRRAARLRRPADFERVRASGRAWSHPLLVLVVAPGGSTEAQPRIGITASRRVGGAVVRNRARRRLSEAIRLRYHRIQSGWDLVIIVRPAAADAAYDALSSAVETLLARSDLLAPEVPCASLP